MNEIEYTPEIMTAIPEKNGVEYEYDDETKQINEIRLFHKKFYKIVKPGDPDFEELEKEFIQKHPDLFIPDLPWDKIKIYTGYFGGMKKYNYPNPISIAGKAPEGWKNPEVKCLAPTWKCYKDYKDEVTDEFGYAQQWWKDHPWMAPTILKKIEEVVGKQEVITLMCYEKAPETDDYLNEIAGDLPRGVFCHRHLISEILRKAGYDSREFRGNSLTN
jgi:hypothetical protein